MSAASLERLKEIFHSAREFPPGKRDAFLTGACGSDEQLRREIDALLESDRAADDFIADPPAGLVADAFGDISSTPSDAGRMIGHYKLLECIGSGGMGAVYLAERADQQFQMQVAIKLIKRGMDTDSVLRRFQHERQILASLEHPNIARLLDGGTTDDGVPYFVMEYIEGHRIDRYAEEHQLPISERLELFRQVCGAVSYAHQRLVVHRDLKPSNILVTPSGVPKLLDFGIAKIIQPNDSAEALPTITLVPIMTPEYASPEQIEGAPATTLSDVYSLGAVLYELLAGRPPYRLENRSPQEIEKAISTAQIEKPSAVAIRPEDARRLRGDLDNIVRMAMRKETARRYRSVEQFSEDIRRHLTGRPVGAQPDTLSYRSGKFLRRNRLAVSAAALLFLTLVGGIIATTWQARLARMGFDVPEQSIWTAALATAQFLADQRPGGTAYVIGEAGLTTAMHAVGYVLTDYAPDYVVLGETRTYSFEAITKAVRLINDGARFICTNPDPTGPSNEGALPAAGSVAAMISKATGVDPYFVGKPNPMMMRSALNVIGGHSESTAMIGDRMDTDVLCGLEAGLETILVLTGISTRAESDRYPYRPSRIVDSVADLIAEI